MKDYKGDDKIEELLKHVPIIEGKAPQTPLVYHGFQICLSEGDLTKGLKSVVVKYLHTHRSTQGFVPHWVYAWRSQRENRTD